MELLKGYNILLWVDLTQGFLESFYQDEELDMNEEKYMAMCMYSSGVRVVEVLGRGCFVGSKALHGGEGG